MAPNADKAEAVWNRDREIDEIYNSLFRELLTYMMEDPRTIGLCTHLLFVAKNIERSGDHATNIAEVVYHMVRAEDISQDAAQGRHHQRGGDAVRRKPHEQAPVLVAEDEGALVTLLRYNLEREGYRVLEARDGEEALLRSPRRSPIWWCWTGCCRDCRASRSAAACAAARKPAMCPSSC